VIRAIRGSAFGSKGGRRAGASPEQAASDSHASAGAAEIHFAVAESSLGAVLIAAREKGVCSIMLGDDPEAIVFDLKGQFPRAMLGRGGMGLNRLAAKVVWFIEKPEAGLDLPIDLRGTPFQNEVWAALREIPGGAKASYTEIALRIGRPRSVRAVAQACAANPIALAIPCHRVVRNNGALSGYRWGVERKQALLDREARAF
jgi:AraC family transcriptional regulator of adaptative response/methylated-DNA-[protein]-cysteine methyltransferase